MIPYAFLVTCALAGSYQNAFNVYYVLVPQKYMTQAMAFRRTFIGIVSFLSALLGGKILDVIQANGNMVFGIHIYAQQFLALVAFPLWGLGFYLTYKLVINPIEKRQKENKE